VKSPPAVTENMQNLQYFVNITGLLRNISNWFTAFPYHQINDQGIHRYLLRYLNFRR
jgi:hypothetical protein